MTLRIHRQFIGAIAAAAIAITGFTAAPARAGDDEVGAALAALLGLAIVGAVIHDKKKDKKRHQVHTPVHPKPIHKPKRVNRKLLPQHCLRSFSTDRGHRRLFGQRCLHKNYKFVNSLPHSCHREVYTHRGWRAGYGARCLSRHGFQLARH
jgi:hypothetical protein